MDKVNYERYLLLELSYEQILYWCFPVLYPIHNLPDTMNLVDEHAVKKTKLPSPINLSLKSLSNEGVYLLDNGINIFMWFGDSCSESFVTDLFSCKKIEVEHIKCPEV